MAGTLLDLDMETLEAVNTMLQSMIRQACQTFPLQ
jgi:hypothetical protein